MLACPSMSWMTFSSAPAARARPAAPCLRSSSPDRRQPRLSGQPPESPGQPVGGHRVTAEAGEHVPAVAVALPRLIALSLLRYAVRAQHRHCRVVQGDDPLAVPGLGQFTGSFDAVLAGAGIEAIKIPPRSPRAKRLRGTVRAHRRAEVTDRMLIFGERHLRLVLAGAPALLLSLADGPRGAVRAGPPAATTAEDPIAHSSCGHPARPARPARRRPLPGNEPSASLPSAASSANMNGPPKTPGQAQWHSSGTPPQGATPLDKSIKR